MENILKAVIIIYYSNMSDVVAIFSRTIIYPFFFKWGKNFKLMSPFEIFLKIVFLITIWKVD